MSLMHPLAKVRGAGTAKSGVEHWWSQRLTAIALVPLTLWVIASIFVLMREDYQAVYAWVGDPLHAAGLIAWIVTMLYHAQLGLQVVIEDYVGHPATELVLHLLVKFICFAGIIVSVLSILKVALGGQS